MAQHAGANRRSRRIANDVISALQSDGFFRHFTPAQFGGLEGTPQAFFLDQIAIAERDMSTAWAMGIAAVHNFQIALMDRRAPDEVFADGPDTMISSSHNPAGATVEMADGGFMLSGRWGWSSGSLHCNWVLLGGVIAGEGYRTFPVPAGDYAIEDKWYTMGLQATGSNDIVIAEPVFVPAYRTHKQMDGFHSVHQQDNPFYGLPWAQVFIHVVNTSAIGAVRHSLPRHPRLRMKACQT